MAAPRRLVWGSLRVGILALLLAGGSVPAAADTVKWTAVPLGTHKFGHLSAPDAIVAGVGPKGVAFENRKEGDQNGPWSFDVAADGSIGVGVALLYWRRTARSRN